ncbi:MAG: phospholipase D-like domain-containing protein [Candidatus Odinarchaeia archaeon]
MDSSVLSYLAPGNYSSTINITCYSSPDSSYEITINALRSAKYEIDIMMYSISNGFILKELNDAMSRNTSMVINVIVSSTHASYWEENYTRSALYNLSKAAENVGATNVNLYLSSNIFQFTHAKVIIVDRELVLIQSANWAKTSVPPDPSYGNREWGVAINDSDVADYYLQVFNHDLAIATVYSPSVDDSYTTFSSYVPTDSYSHPFSAQNFIEAMSIQTIVSPNNSKDAIIALLRSANESICVQQAYIKLEWDGSSDLFLDELEAAVARGVTVKVIIQKDTSSANETASYMVSKGIQVVYSSDVFEFCHNKGIIVDGKIVLISSINWSYESVYENREAGIIIANENVAGFFLEIFNWDWQNGEPVSTQSIPQDYVMITSIAVIILAIIVVALRKIRK